MNQTLVIARHVCGGWDANVGRLYRSPLDKYRSAFDGRVIKSLIVRPIPARPVRARDKASAMLLKCLSRVRRQSTLNLRQVLLELGLSWPLTSAATRAALLQTLVKSSLHFGLHVFWAFYVGPHPSLPHRSAIYTTLDERCIEWIRDFELLIARGTHHNYLRRCAEIVGGTGQSYSGMIEAVTVAHEDIAQQVHLLWDPAALPAFQNLTDPALRRAVNGHLPDDAQLWPGDEIVNMQPELFKQLNATHLSHRDYIEGFKLFLGAYVVWVLSPWLSRYLASGMLADIGWASTEEAYRYDKCLDAVEFVMPLAKWKIEHDTQAERSNSWQLMRLSALSIKDLDRIYGEVFTKLFAVVVDSVSTNAYNMTLSWSMIDKVYVYVRLDSRADFFDGYVSAAGRGVDALKKSMRRPLPTMLHAPGISSNALYRLLVAREVIVRNFRTAPPLFGASSTQAVQVAVAGTLICRQLIVLARFIFFYDDRFKYNPPIPILRYLEPLLRIFSHYEAAMNSSGFLSAPTRRERRELMTTGMATHIASNILRLPEVRATAEAALPPTQRAFRNIPAEQLYFLISCFTHCGATGRELRVQRAICNVAIPSVAAFREAFQCRPHHRLVTNFTWPEATRTTGGAAL
ncbi:hypothetical protein V5799_015654 [Amblyomma americanum]|uniref:Uncharacterized protein n=1 Tax=Amblyomma americanum TaxID=6943 RepID=A0AAQ4F8D9_AMBAM